MKNEKLLKEEICEIGRRVYLNGFVAANDGNITVRLGQDEFLTTPTGVSKGYMKPEMIVKVNSRGEVLDGEYKMSSEIKVHLQIYRDRPDVNAVVHAHPPFATAHAVSGIPLDKYMMPETIFSLGSVPLVPYVIPASQELADEISKYLKDYDAFLLENHGALAVGDSLENAYFKIETTEFYAKICLLTKLIGSQRELPSEEIIKLAERRLNSGVPGMYPGVKL